MTQRQIFILLKKDRRYWSVEEIAMALEIRKASVIKSLNSMCRMTGMAVRYELVQYGFRKLYKYEGENGG